MFVRHSISVLLEETIDLVRDVVSVMSNSEGRLSESWLLEDLGILRLA